MRTLFICMGILLSSCTEMIEVQTNDTDPVLVVYGSVTTETSYQTIEISRSAPYFKNDSNLQISDAKVTIESTDGKPFGIFRMQGVHSKLFLIFTRKHKYERKFKFREVLQAGEEQNIS